MRLAVLVLSAFALIATPAAAQAEIVATPTGPWQAALDGKLCRIERSFEAGGQPHLVILEQNAPGPGFGMALAGAALTGLKGTEPVRLTFDAGGQTLEWRARVQPNSQFGQVAILTGLAPIARRDGTPRPFARIDTDILGAMDRITLAQGDVSVTFATGTLGEAATVLNECTAQLLRTWGLDPEPQYRLQRLAFPEEPQPLARRMLQVIRNLDLRSGPFEAVALVDATGKATGCRVLPGPGYDALDEVACGVMMKAHYLPALDTSGQPVASFWKTRVAYNVLDPERLQLSMQPGEP
jgi:hypothetical protein